MDHHPQKKSSCCEKSRHSQEKESHLGPQETSHAQEEADHYQAKTGGAPSYAVAEKETRDDQTETNGLKKDEYEEAQTPNHQKEQTFGHHQEKESDPYEIN